MSTSTHENLGLSIGVSESLASHSGLSDEARVLALSELEAPIIINEDHSIRAKITDICGMTCVFCHNEGTPVNIPQINSGRTSIFQLSNGVNFNPGQMMPDEQFVTALTKFMRSLETDELHWTGGEPSTHRDLARLTEIATGLGLRVKMTSNGESAGRKMSELKSAGLQSVNFSIFGTTPDELAAVQSERYQDPRLAAIKLTQLDQSIKAARNEGLSVKANIVMQDAKDRDRVIRVLNRYSPIGVNVRILPDLSHGIESPVSIYNLLAELDASIENIVVTAGSSNLLVNYRLPDGNQIGYKQIRNSRLPGICDSCSYNNEDCKEGYYGVRMYIDNDNNYLVGVCIQRMDLTIPLDDFVSGNLPEMVRQFRADDLQKLRSTLIRE